MSEKTTITFELTTNWIKCSDRLPEEQEIVLVFVPKWHEPVSVGKRNGDRWAVVSCIGSIQDVEYNQTVTHWTPLPEPPGVEQGAK